MGAAAGLLPRVATAPATSFIADDLTSIPNPSKPFWLGARAGDRGRVHFWRGSSHYPLFYVGTPVLDHFRTGGCLVIHSDGRNLTNSLWLLVYAVCELGADAWPFSAGASCGAIRLLLAALQVPTTPYCQTLSQLNASSSTQVQPDQSLFLTLRPVSRRDVSSMALPNRREANNSVTNSDMEKHGSCHISLRAESGGVHGFPAVVIPSSL
ncbi:hypothetical protein B0T24DRAFT_389626 [Lasiosphaeria ovina]|uniref:Uncharacterized protein n=1 Tax=Lasiosphaeria ovina TaxID=92902 RepID=A0AAE0N2U3_9PEZI|nr:hypothetical protein B0T24DRAFT_389626 [Lasiosphaeria ovina]